MNDWLNRCHFGDVRDVLRKMIADGVKVQTIVTSPPYWGLRSYLPAGHADKAREIGSEPTLQEFLATMVGVFALCREVLADDGTMWVNMGDAYAGSWGAQSRGGPPSDKSTLRGNGHLGGGPKVNSLSKVQVAAAQHMTRTGSLDRTPGLKPKDKMLQPHRLAIALQDDGWWVRDDIVWNKPNPMPESVTDRPTNCKEYIFLLAKAEKYYCDMEAILEPVSPNTHARLSQNVQAQIGSARANGGAKTNGNMKAVGRCSSPPNNPVERGVGWGHGTDAEERNRGRVTRKLADGEDANKNNESFDAALATMPSERNKRNVWTVPTQSYSGAHFATFPTKLIEPCVLAGAPAGGVVLDIFMGSGTTAQVAEQLGRQWIGIDIDERNAVLQAQRLRQPSLALEAA